MTPSRAQDAPLPSPRSPEVERRSFELDARFVIELVAHEPMVRDPVAIAWDAACRPWVVEMSDYPLESGGGRIRVLHDDDGDGLPDRSEVFAEGLAFPTSALPFRRGCLVTSAPDIRYLEDSDGDGRADVDHVVLTGFHPGNTQLRVNGLVWGLDGRVYVANGRSGGRVRRPVDDAAAAVDIARRDLRFDPLTYAPESISGPSQFGHAFDDHGHRFLSWNTVHIRQDMLLPADLERNPRLLRTETVAHTSDHGDSARIFARVPPPRTFNNEPTDHFNASCGLTIERGGLFPQSHRGNAFVCEPLVGIVHRDVLTPSPSGPVIVASRGEEGAEFLSSDDPWFHPVNLRSGPDGALYVVDFYRELVEHPHYVPEHLRGGVEFARGKGHGRIWRVRPRDAALWPAFDLGAASGVELVAQLGHGSGFRRETAQRLLLERGEALPADVLAALRRAAGSDSSLPPVGRAYALWTLGRLGRLEDAQLAAALASPSAALREHAVRLARELAPPRQVLVESLDRLLRDPAPAVRFAAALAAGDVPDTSASSHSLDSLAQAVALARDDPWCGLAALSSVHGRLERFVASLEKEAARSDRPAASLVSVLEDAGHMATHDVSLSSRLMRRVLANESGAPVATRLALAAGLGAGLEGRVDELRRLRETLADLREERRAFESLAREVVTAERLPLGRRRAALAALVPCSSEALLEAIELCLRPFTALDLQRDAVRRLAGLGSRELAARLPALWPRATPGVRAAAIDSLASRPGGARAVLDAIEAGVVQPLELAPHQREALERALAGDEAARLAAVFAPRERVRERVVERYLAALAARAAPDDEGSERAAGSQVFSRVCSPCHRLGDTGYAVGPDLSGVGRTSEAELVATILDPNRSILPGYTAYAVVTVDGQIIRGVLASETAGAVTLRRAGGEETAIARARIREISVSDVSLMPENLEEGLTPADMAALLAFLRAGTGR